MTDTRFKLYQRWILLIGGLSVLLGLAMMTTGEMAFWEAYNRAYARAFFGTDVMTPEIARLYRFVMGVAGAGVAGWGVMFTFVAAVPFARREPWAFHSILWSVVTWVTLDVILCVVGGVWSEMVLAISVAAGAAPPLILSWPAFRRR